MSGLIQNDLQPVESSFGEPTTPTYDRSDDSAKVYGRPAEGLPPPQYSEKEKDLKRQIEKLEKKLEETPVEGLTEDKLQGLKDLEFLRNENEIEIDGKKHTLVNLDDYNKLVKEKNDMQEKNTKLKSENEAIKEDAKTQIETLSNELQKAEESNKDLVARNEEIVEQTEKIKEYNFQTINNKIEELQSSMKNLQTQVDEKKLEQLKKLQAETEKVQKEAKKVLERSRLGEELSTNRSDESRSDGLTKVNTEFNLQTLINDIIKYTKIDVSKSKKNQVANDIWKMYQDKQNNEFAVYAKMITNNIDVDKFNQMVEIGNEDYFRYIELFLRLDQNESGSIGGDELNFGGAANNVLLSTINDVIGTGELTIQRLLQYAAIKKGDFFNEPALEDFFNEAFAKEAPGGMEGSASTIIERKEEKGFVANLIDWL